MKRLLASLLITFLLVVSYAHAEILTGITDGITWTYEGDAVNGKPHGQGTTTYANGDKYIGEWKGDIKHGQGTLTWSDGSKFVGESKEDRARNGTHYDKDGNAIITFSEGVQKPVN